MNHEKQVLERVLDQYANNRVNVSETDQEKAKTDKLARDVIGLCGNGNIMYWEFYRNKIEEYKTKQSEKGLK